MEKIMFFKYNSIENVITTHSVDFKSIIPFLENQDFCVVSICDKDGKEIEDYNSEWVRKEHGVYIQDLVDIDEDIKIYHIHILIENSGFICFDVGQLSVKLSDNYNLSKLKSIELLKSFGVYCAKETWELCRHHNVSMPVYFLIGTNSKEFEKTSLKMIKEAYRVDAFHKDNDSKKRYIIEWPNGKIKEVGFEQDNQKIGECKYFNENGINYKTEYWMLDASNNSFIYSTITHNKI